MSAKKTDLIDRYLHAVKFWLPVQQQDDILAELAEDMQSQVEERESALGHPLEEADLVELLKRRGAPMRVASGYIPEYRLVNPAMLPLYWMVLKIVLLWVLFPLLGIVLVRPLFNSAQLGPALLSFIGEAFRGVFLVIGIVTMVFALMDRYYAKWVDVWDPRKLPRVPSAHPQMQWYNDFAGFALGTGAVIFWAVVMWHRNTFVITPEFRVNLAPIWGQLYWVVLGLTMARALVDLYCFVRRGWTRGQSWGRVVLDVAGMALALVLLWAGNWVELVMPNATPAEAAKLISMVHSGFQVTFVICVIIPVVDVIKQLRLLYRGKTGQSTQALTVS